MKSFGEELRMQSGREKVFINSFESLIAMGVVKFQCVSLKRCLLKWVFPLSMPT